MTSSQRAVFFILSITRAHAILVKGTVVLPESETKHVKVWIDGGRYILPVTKSGDFVASILNDGEYLIEFVSPKYLFRKYRLIVNYPNYDITYVDDAASWDRIVTQLGISLMPPLAKLNFKIVKGHNLFSLLGNPVILVTVVSLLAVVVLPKIVKLASLNSESLNESRNTVQQSKKDS